MRKRAALYCRVSTDEQAADGYSLAHQEKTLRDAAEREGLEVVGVYRDDDSGRDDDRPDFQRMYLDAKAGMFDVVLVYMWSRWFRNVLLSKKWKHEFRKKLGVEVRSVTQPGDPDDPAGFLSEGFFELIDEYHSVEKSTLVRAGKRQKASEGLSLGNSSLGYVSDRGQLTVRPEGSRVLLRMAELYESPNASFSGVAKSLADEGVVNPLGGKAFTSNTVRRLLLTPTNAGYVVHHEARYQGRHQAIFDAARFGNLVALAESRRGRAPTRYTYQTGTLSGLCRCLRCGSSLTAWRHETKTGSERLKCEGRRARQACDAPGTVAYPLVEVFEVLFNRMSVSPEVVADVEELATQRQPSVALTTTRSEVQDRLRRAGVRYEVGELDEAEYRRRVRAYQRELESLADAPVIDRARKNLGELLRTYGQAWSMASTEERNSLLKSMCREVRLDRGDRIEIYPHEEFRGAFRAAMTQPMFAVFPKVGQTAVTRSVMVPVFIGASVHVASVEVG
jgi:site-specific DNA recombinase